MFRQILKHPFPRESAAEAKAHVEVQTLHSSQQLLSQPSSQQLSQPESTLDDILSQSEDPWSQVLSPSNCSACETSPPDDDSEDEPEPSAARSDVSNFSNFSTESDVSNISTSSVASTSAPILPGFEPFSDVHLLLVSRNGFGRRVSLLEVGIRRRSRWGKKVWRPRDDQVAAICVVPGVSQSQLPLPEKPRDPFTIHMARHLEVHGSESKLNPVDAFAELNQEARIQLSLESAREHENYTRAVAKRRQVERWSASRRNIFICTAEGIANRLALETIQPRRGAGRDRLLLKVPPGDRVCSACLLSVADDAPDEWARSSIVGSTTDLETSLPGTPLGGTSLPGTPMPDTPLPATPLPGTPTPGTPESQGA